MPGHQLTDTSVEAWIADNDPDGEEKLAAQLVAGALGEELAAAALAHFLSNPDRFRVVKSSLDQSLAKRQPLGVWGWAASVAASRDQGGKTAAGDAHDL